MFKLKRVLSAIIAFIMIIGIMPTFALADEPVLTENPLAEPVWYNGYSGKDPAEYNANTLYKESENVLSSEEGKKLFLYAKYDMRDYVNENISKATLYFAPNSNASNVGQTFCVYGFDYSDWRETAGPKVDETNILDEIKSPSTWSAIQKPEFANTSRGSTFAYFLTLDVTDAVKKAIKNGDDHFCLAVGRKSSGWGTYSLHYYPAVSITTTTNNVPNVQLYSENAADKITVTASGSDDDKDNLSYTFYVDGSEADSSLVSGNTLTIPATGAVRHDVTVKCSDGKDYDIDSITVSNIATDSEEDTYYNQLVGLFKTLGLYDDDVPADTRKIGRAEFVSYMIRLMSGNTPAASVKSEFWDVAEDNEFYDDICAGLGYGIIHGNSDGSFEPYDYITNENALRIVLNALGYSSYIKLMGNTNAALLSVANKTGISCPGNVGEPLTFKGMLELLYDSLDALMLESSSFTADSTSFETNGRTLLETYRNIHTISGIVNANTITAIDGGSASGGQVKVGDTKISGANALSDSCLGYNVDCFAYKGDGSYKFIYAVKNTHNDTLEISFDDIANVTSSKLTYYDGNKTKTVELDASTAYVYNGVSADFSKYTINDLFAKTYGKVVFIDNDSANAYDVALIDVYDTIVVRFADLENEILYDKNSAKYNVDYSNADTCEIYDTEGNILTSVSEDTVLTVMQSLGGEYVKIIASHDVINGEIKEINDDGTVVVRNKVYYLTDEFTNSAENGIIAAGTSGTMLMDMNGRIAHIQSSSASDKKHVAFMVGVNAQGTFAKTVQLKLYTTEGEYEVYTLPEKLKIDGKNYKTASDIYDYLMNGNAEFIPVPIAYKISDGVINYIDTPVKGDNEDDSTLVSRYKGNEQGKLFYKGSSNVNYRSTFGGKFISNADSFRVIIDDTENYDDLQLLLSLKDDVSYSVDIYSFGEDSPFGDVALIRGTASTAVTANVYIFKSMSKVVDTTEKHDSRLKIKCYLGAAENTLTMAYESHSAVEGTNVISENSRTNMTKEQIEACAGLRPGDLFRVALDSRGDVSVVEKIYDYENKLFINPIADAAVYNQSSAFADNKTTRVLLGDVYLMQRGYARFSTTEIDVNDPNLDSKLESIYAAGHLYTVDDRGNIEITQITTGEQILGKKNGEDIKIFISAEYTRPQRVYFIK